MSVSRIASLTFGAAALLATSVAIAGPGRGPGHGPGGPFGHIIQQIDLTDEQVDMLEGFKEEARADREARRAEGEAARATFKAELQSGKPNAAVLHDLIDQRLAAQAEVMHAHLDDMLALYATFTPDQLRTVNELLENPPERGDRGPRGPRQRGGPDDFDF